MVNHRFLMIAYPAQGHINPALRFAKRLINMGAQVTFVTSTYLYRRMNKPNTPGLSFAAFSDGHDDGYKANFDANVNVYIGELKERGSEFFRELIPAEEKEGRPFTGIIYSLLLPWAAAVAREFHLPSALLWIQPATVFSIYYHYYHEYGTCIIENSEEPQFSLELPGMSYTFTKNDLPSFLLANNMYNFALPTFREHFRQLDLESSPVVLVNTFEESESEALKSIGKIKQIPIGPLIPSAFLDGKDIADSSIGGITVKHDYLEWMDSQPERSVVYVSFGTLVELPKTQMEEIARGLLDSGRPFLWVIRETEKEKEKENGKVENENKESNGKEEKENKELSCREELEKLGRIVKWCSQVDVLSHPSLGCFVTHCGWNSTLETLASGVPLVAFPQWTDQATSAKLIEDVWKTGVRVDHHVTDDGLLRAEELKRCVDLVMGKGEKGEELRKNVTKWKHLAREAVKEGGSSEKNLRSFLDVYGRVAVKN